MNQPIAAVMKGVSKSNTCVDISGSFYLLEFADNRNCVNRLILEVKESNLTGSVWHILKRDDFFGDGHSRWDDFSRAARC